jgi:hypothetical protein
MIKTVVIPHNNTLKLSIPNEYIGKEVEILIYANEEVQSMDSLTENMNSEQKLFDKYGEKLHSDVADKLKAHIKRTREE